MTHQTTNNPIAETLQRHVRRQTNNGNLIVSPSKDGNSFVVEMQYPSTEPQGSLMRLYYKSTWNALFAQDAPATGTFPISLSTGQATDIASRIETGTLHAGQVR
jgi:hypothetical protein